ncbi:MAG: tetratricopeptide repeat protein, partial [Cyanobacteria bacterium]|nr:tetratricopeptide repeat protein [Cyanobacteriota bacterium]
MRVSKAKAAKSLVIGILLGLTCNTAAQAAPVVENAQAHYQLGNALVRAGKHQQAIAEYRTAYRLSPKSKVG